MPPSRLVHAIAIAAARGKGQDRAGVFEVYSDIVIALADGAGGTGNGARAAQAIVDTVGAVQSARHDWVGMLGQLDRDAARLSRGQSTAVIVSICDGVLSGASVGDSGAWLLRDGDAIDLTEGQHRKPLVGAGCVVHVIPQTCLGGGTLLVASDGLLRYAKQADIVRAVHRSDLAAAAAGLIELVRLPGGALQDDVAVVLCREPG